jgi:hypothetical protein
MNRAEQVTGEMWAARQVYHMYGLLVVVDFGGLSFCYI